MEKIDELKIKGYELMVQRLRLLEQLNQLDRIINENMAAVTQQESNIRLQKKQTG